MNYPKAPFISALALCLCTGLLAPADQVFLKSGAVLEGRILKENSHELILEVARTSDSSVRTQKVILHSAVDRVQRGAPKVAIVEETSVGAPGAPEPQVVTEEGDGSLSPSDQKLIHKLKEAMQTSVGLLSDGHYDRALQTYSLISKHQQLLDLEKQGGKPALASLHLREESHRLWVAAIEGKIEYNDELIDKREEQIEDMLDQAEERLRKYEDEHDDNRRRNRDEKVVIKMKRGNTPDTPVDQKKEELERMLERAKDTEQRFKAWEKETTLANRNLEAEANIIKEAHKKIREDLKSLERELRR